MRRILVLGAALAALAPAPAAGAALETVVQDDRLLLHQAPGEVRASMKRLRELGVDRVRLTAGWSTLTRKASSEKRPDFDARDPAAYEQERFRGLDTAVRLARETGLAVVMDLGFWGPHWATDDPPGPRARTNVDPQAFTDFAIAVSRRYSGTYAIPAKAAAEPPPEESEDEQLVDGILGEEDDEEQQGPPPPPSPEPLPAVDRFILWNEPNHPGLFMPQLRDGRPVSPALYRRMLEIAYPAVKEVRPDATFLVGNTSSIGGSTGVGPQRFIREIACVDRRMRPLRTPECEGFEGPVPGDGWAHHPYPRNEIPSARMGKVDDIGISDVPRMADLLGRLVDAGRLAPGLRWLHLTEFGYETSDIGDRRTVTEAEQAQWLTWSEAIATRTPGVRSFAQFLLADQPPAEERISQSRHRGHGQWFSGLHFVDGRPKLAATTFTAGLFAQRAGRGRALLFVRLRLGDGPRRVTVERSTGGPWREVLARDAGGRDAFEAEAPWSRGSRYRLTWPGDDGARVTGPAFAAVPAAPPAPRSAVVRLARRAAASRRLRRSSKGAIVRFRTTGPGTLTARVVRRGRTLTRDRRTILETSPYRIRLQLRRAERRAVRRGGARVVVRFAGADGAVSSARRRLAGRR